MNRSRRCARRRPARGEAGQLAGIEAVPFALLVLVVGALVVANAWAVIDAKLAVDAAAREATRTYVEGWPDPVASWRQAQAVGQEAATAQGRQGSRVELQRTLEPGYQRCARVRITASYRLPALSLPFIGGVAHGFTVSSTHSEVIDPYRSGGTAGGGCA